MCWQESSPENAFKGEKIILVEAASPLERAELLDVAVAINQLPPAGRNTLGSSWVLETPLGHVPKEEWAIRDPLGAQLPSPCFLGDLWERQIRSSFMPHKLHRCQRHVTGN